jgi:hypothetical protein
VIVTYETFEAAAKRATIALLALAVCACAHDKPKRIEDNAAPEDFRAQVVEQVRRQLNPKNVRDAYIAEPVLKTSLPTPRFVSCLRFNATDSGGAYKGSRDYAAYFFAGKITQIVNASVEQCDKADYLPFPELQSH